MKKLATLLVLLLGVLGLVFGGCSDGGTFSKKSYSAAENEIEKVTVQVEERELEISASEDNRVHIDYFDGEKEYLTVVSGNGELTVRLENNKNWTDYFGVKPSAQYRKIKIGIPDNRLAAITVTTTNGDIILTDLAFLEQVSLGANGGNIVCERVSVGKSIDLTAKNGNISGAVIGGWDDFSISCKIKKGKCNLPELKEGGGKAFTAVCNNGDINIAFVK